MLFVFLMTGCTAVVFHPSELSSGSPPSDAAEEDAGNGASSPAQRTEGGALDASAVPGDAGSDGCVLHDHVDGFGDGWKDCAPLGTYTLAEAMAACNAYRVTHAGGYCLSNTPACEPGTVTWSSPSSKASWRFQGSTGPGSASETRDGGGFVCPEDGAAQWQ